MSTWTSLGYSKKPWNMKVTIILILIGALGRVTKGFVQGPDDREIID